MNKKSTLSPEIMPSPDRRRVFIVTLVAFILGLAANLVSANAADSQNVLITYWIWRSMAFLGLPILWISWKGSARLAAWLLISVFMASMAASVVLVSGLGVLSGGSIVFLGVVLAILMSMSNDDIVRVTFVSLALGLPVILFDYYGPIRPPAPAETLQGLKIFFVVDLVAYFLLAYRNYANFPLRYKLISALTLAALIPLSVNIFVTIRNTSANLLQNANTQLATTASETAAALDTFIENTLDNVRTIAQIHDMTDFLLTPPSERTGSELETAVYQNLRAVANLDPTFITSVGLMDINGRNIADTDFTQLGEIEADKAFFTETLDSSLPYVSTVQDDEGALSLYFSAPVRDTTGEPIGVLRVRYNAAVLQAILVESARNIETEGIVLDLLDENNIFLGITDEPDEILHTVSTLSAEKFAQLQEEGRLPEDGTRESLSLGQDDLAEALANASQTPTFELASESEQAAVVPLKNHSWMVLAGQPEEIFLAPLNSMYRTSAVLAVVIIILSVIAALLGTRMISAPIVTLTRVVEKISTGELSLQAKAEAEDEIGTLANSFNQMTAQLRETLAGLEQRVTDRTQALAATVTIGQRLASLLDQQDIIQEVVDQLQKAFGYYHVHIYLFDKEQKNLKMSGGSGLVGKALFNMGHQIPAGKGLVGRAANTNQVVLVSDVAQEVGWLPNPLLPETKSEVAVPISKGTQVLGVIDVQQNAVNGLTEVDAGLLENIAAQVAVALQNADLFAQVQRNAERQVFLAQVNTKIQNTNDMESALKVAVRELGRALNAKQTYVQLKTTEEAKKI